MDLEGMGLDDINQHLREIHGTLIAIAAGVSGIAEMLGQDLQDRDPEAYVRAQKAIARRTHEWEQMIREVQ